MNRVEQAPTTTAATERPMQADAAATGSSAASAVPPPPVQREATLATADLDTLLDDLHRCEEIISHWDESQQGVVQALRQTLETLHREALRRLIAALRDDPEAARRLRAAVKDELVYAVLRHFGLVRPSLQERVAQALNSVRPMLAAHGGDVELLEVLPPDTVKVRLLGACEGCPASGLTLTAGVEKAIREACPEITRVECASGSDATGTTSRNDPEGSGRTDGDRVGYISPFALHARGDWHPAGRLQDIPEGGVCCIEVAGESLLLSRNGGAVSCFSNACAHMAMPLDGGLVEDGILVCPHHGFRYDLRTGECLTAPEVQLHTHAVRVIGDRVEVMLAAAA